MLKVEETIRRLQGIHAVALDRSTLYINNMSMKELNKLIEDSVAIMNLLDAPLSEQDRADLDIMRRIRGGEIKKCIKGDYTIINGDFYRAYPPMCFTTEPRVLSMEEIPGYDGAFLIEYRHEIWPMQWTLYRLEHKPNFRFIRADNEIGFSLNTESYSKTWRCWTSRPTDEQREAVKWND